MSIIDACHTVIRNLCLVVGGTPSYRVIECEAYFYSEAHPDPFVHRHPQQLVPSSFYFHRTTRSPTALYRGGTFKGLDLTSGNGKDEYFGILIRSIVDQQDEVSEGSCKCVDKILSHLRMTISELVSVCPLLEQPNGAFTENPYLYFGNVPEAPVIKFGHTIRVGLKQHGYDDAVWIARPYRVFDISHPPRKERQNIVNAVVT